MSDVYVKIAQDSNVFNWRQDIIFLAVPDEKAGIRTMHLLYQVFAETEPVAKLTIEVYNRLRYIDSMIVEARGND